MATASSGINFLTDRYEWRGHSIYYVKAGRTQKNKPPLLLVHGFGASTDHWRKNIVELQNNFQVFAIDLLGFGRSSKAAIEYNGELWRDQLVDFIDRHIGQPTILAGNSLGGYASLCVAAQKPNAAAGLILINSAGPFSDTQSNQPVNPLQKFIGRGIRSLLLQPWANYLLFQYVRKPSVIRQTLNKVYLDKNAVTDRLVEEIYQPSCDPGAAEVFASVFKTPQGEKVDILLQNLSCPLLTIWGQGDPWMNSQQRGQKFRQYYPNLTEHYVLAGHCPHDEIPETVNNLITNWLEANY